MPGLSKIAQETYHNNNGKKVMVIRKELENGESSISLKIGFQKAFLINTTIYVGNSDMIFPSHSRHKTIGLSVDYR